MVAERKLTEAIREAERFLERAKRLKESVPSQYLTYEGKDAASVKRSSMDLTRALADLRRSQ